MTPTDGKPTQALGAGQSRNARIVAFGGGTGMAALLRGLKAYSDEITAVVTVTDNGGSSGRLRNEFDIGAPGDIRNCLIALADADPLIVKAFQYRFHESEFKGHSFGNLFITVLTRVLGDFNASILELNRLLRVRGRVIPAAGKKLSIVARHPDGTKSTGEVQVSRSNKPIEQVELRPDPVVPSPEIKDAVRDADVFLFGPGSLYTSVIPNLLLDGVVDAINATGKPRVYISNIMTQPGETTGYSLGDHIRALRRHVGDDFPDAVITHRGEIPPHYVAKYRASGADSVENDLLDGSEFTSIRVIQDNLFAEGDVDTVGSAKTGTVRHNSNALARVIYEHFLAPGSRGVEGLKTDASGRRPEQGVERPGGGRARSGATEDVVERHGTRAFP